VITSLTGGSADTPLRAGLALCRYVLAFPPVAAMSPDEIVAWLSPTIQRHLIAPVG
jgi:tetracycline repressor-like protein